MWRFFYKIAAFLIKKFIQQVPNMKYLLFVIFFLIPSLLFALNEKECNHYFDLSIEEVKTSKLHLHYADCTQVEMKIFQLNAAMQSLQRAVLNLDVVLNAIHALKSHKLRPWHRAIKEKCKRQKEICFSAAYE